MIVFPQESSMMFDVDDTLVMWGHNILGRNPVRDRKDYIMIPDPYWEGEYIRLWPNHDHIRLLRRARSRGRLVGVWSHGGARWAETVIKGLGLQMYPHFIMTKPDDYVDDIPIENWGMRNLYCKNGFGSSNND